jgi:hypothetical protein
MQEHEPVGVGHSDMFPDLILPVLELVCEMMEDCCKCHHI